MGAIFSAPVQTAPGGPPTLPYNGYPVFPGGKERPGRDADPSPPSSAVGHERVELYLYYPLWAVRLVQSLSACTRVTFTFTLYIYTLNTLVIFHTPYPLHTFTISITNNNFNILTDANLTIANRTAAGINYNELYDCKQDPMTLKNNTLYTPAFKFL